MYACGEATNGRLGLGMSSGTVPIPRQVPALSSYVVKKVAVHSGTCRPPRVPPVPSLPPSPRSKLGAALPWSCSEDRRGRQELAGRAQAGVGEGWSLWEECSESA